MTKQKGGVMYGRDFDKEFSKLSQIADKYKKMTKQDYKQYADPNCPICGGKGYIEVEDLHHPDDWVKTSIKKEWCSCALNNYEK